MKLLISEAEYSKEILEATLDEVAEQGTHTALQESVSKSRQRNKEKTAVG